ncbi:twk-18 [Pristionchus pacificus]|uniref:Twk-18 n=1 Tax=Pristionchus pacificus TaxID=54126 RepID=A0A2A6CFA0_PRIPA|nr:twk-18 [Pristionchus pacificus]|eukprot:PDM76681.1 twk-18 [Pristionchus pacificus]
MLSTFPDPHSTMGVASMAFVLRENLRSGVKSILPVLVLILYTILGALIFQWIEGDQETAEIDVLREMRERAIEKTAFELNVLKSKSPIEAYNYTVKVLKKYNEKVGIVEADMDNLKWSLPGAIFFCITVYTTIGYGNIYPVTTTGRVVTIIYAFIGIPITVICLYSLGQLLARVCRLIWKAFLRTTRVVSKDLSKKVEELGEKTNSDAGSDQQKDENDLSSFPVSILLLITVVWVIFSSLLFCYIEDDWNYGTALYFALISFTTIGFGDVLPSNYSYMILIGIVVILGLSIVSTTLSIIQEQIEGLAEGMKGDIDKEYLNALAEAKDEGEVAEAKASTALEGPPENLDVEAHIATMDPRSLDAVVSRMPLRSRILYNIMPASSKKALQKQSEDLVANLVEEELLKLKLAAGPSAPASPSSPAPPAGPAYETSLQ